MTESSNLPSTIAVRIWGVPDREIVFESSADVIAWAEKQIEAWKGENLAPRHAGLKKIFDQQFNVMKAILTAARKLDKMLDQVESAQQQSQVNSIFRQLENALKKISSGEVLTNEHPSSALIIKAAKTDPDVAALLLSAVSSVGQSPAQRHMSGQIPIDIMARAVLFISSNGPELSEELEAHRKAFSSLKSEFDNRLRVLRKRLNDQDERAESFESERKDEKERTQAEWKTFIEARETEWKDLKDVIETKLALRAPTKYWNKRASEQKGISWNWGYAFFITLIIFVILFIFFAIPQLTVPLREGASIGRGAIVLVTLPVLIPVFAGIWILKIIGRQLSESMVLMKDAQEREVLVQTFLALMRNETTEGAIEDKDRNLILTCLFRASRVTTADDSPPLRLSEIFKQR